MPNRRDRSKFFRITPLFPTRQCMTMRNPPGRVCTRAVTTSLSLPSHASSVLVASWSHRRRTAVALPGSSYNRPQPRHRRFSLPRLSPTLNTSSPRDAIAAQEPIRRLSRHSFWHPPTTPMQRASINIANNQIERDYFRWAIAWRGMSRER